MRNNKMITESLNSKIIENEKRMKNLTLVKDYIPKYKHSFQSLNIITSDNKPKKIDHRKHKSQEEIRPINLNKPKKLPIQLSEIKIVEPKEDTNIKLNKVNKKQTIPKKEKPIEKKIIENKNVKNIDINNESTNTNSKKVNKEELDVIVNRLYNNNSKRIKIEIEKDDDNDFNSKKSKVDLNEFYSRFEDDIKRRNENLERKREQMQKLYTYKPKLNINKKFFDEQNNNEDFLERQRNFLEEKKQREEKYKENLMKRENDKIDESNILLKKNKKSRKNISQTINDMENWEKNRKKKIEKKQKEKEDKLLNEFNYTPQINKKSLTMVKRNKKAKLNSNDFLTRLSEQNKVLKEKRKILIELYTPTFQPNIEAKKIKNKNLNSIKEKEFVSISKRNKSQIFEDNNNLDFAEVKPEAQLDKFENNVLKEENIQNAYRKTLFHKHKK